MKTLPNGYRLQKQNVIIPTATSSDASEGNTLVTGEAYERNCDGDDVYGV